MFERSHPRQSLRAWCWRISFLEDVPSSSTFWAEIKQTNDCFFVQKNVGGGGGGDERSSSKSKEWQNEHLILNSCYRFMSHHRTTQAQRGSVLFFYTSIVIITIIASGQYNKHSIKLGRILVGERVQFTSSGLGPRVLGHAVSSLSSIPHHRLTRA